jgi:hypothetical protein
MSPAVTRAARLPHSPAPTPAWPVLSWPSRLVALLAAFGEVLQEAREAERAAHRRHPFIGW